MSTKTQSGQWPVLKRIKDRLVAAKNWIITIVVLSHVLALGSWNRQRIARGKRRGIRSAFHRREVSSVRSELRIGRPACQVARDSFERLFLHVSANCYRDLIPIRLFAVLGLIFFHAAQTMAQTPGSVLTASGLQVGLDSAAHARFGLYYPATFVLGIPGGSSGLTAQYRYDTASAWISLSAMTTSDFFNGIAVARFASASNTVYVSVPFSPSSDTIYLRVINSAGQPVTITYLGISQYYDNRKAAVTIDFDDVEDAHLPDDVQAISLTAAKNLRVTAAVITGHMSNSSWATVQGWMDAGLTEAASHTRTHPCSDAQYGVLGYTSEAVGSRDDLLNALHLPHPFIPTFVGPCGFSDAELLDTIAAAGYLVNRTAVNNDSNFGAWDTAGFYDANLMADTFVSWPTYGSYPNPGGTPALLSSFNSTFDSVYASGGIYQLLDHPWKKLWSPGGYLDQHASYIANRKDVWYATLGELYLYHYLQEREKVSVIAMGAGTPTPTATATPPPTPPPTPAPTPPPTPAPTPPPTPAPTPTPMPKVSAAVALSQGSLNFGTVKVGKSRTRVMTLTNTAKKKGGATITFNGASVAGSSEFGGTSNCNGLVGPKGKCRVIVFFAPTLVGGASSTITVNSNASNGPTSFSMKGTGE